MAIGGLILTGAHVVCYVNGRILGRVTSFHWTKQSTIKRVQGIDTLIPSELIRGPVFVNGQIGLLRTKRDGGAEGAGLTAPMENLNLEQYVSLMLIDRMTDTVVGQFDSCLIESDGWRVDPKGIVTGTLTFQSLKFANEVRPKKPE